MKPFAVLVAVLILMSAAFAALSDDAAGQERKKKRSKESKALQIGAKAEMLDTEMIGTDGEIYTIEQVAGENGTLVMFSCNACPWVVKWEDRIAALGNSYPDKGIGWIVINSNDPGVVPTDDMEHMKKRAKERKFTFPYVVDETSEVAVAYGATKTPEAFLFDADWKLVYHGAIDDDAADADNVDEHFLRDAMDALIEGNKIENSTSKAIGCSIKFRAGEKSGRTDKRGESSERPSGGP